jgi:hypothetical protein
MGENCEGRFAGDREVIRTYDKPILNEAVSSTSKATSSTRRS